MQSTQEQTLELAAWGIAHADLAALQPLRKAIPAWAREGTPGHFLKHADEQTVLAVAALDGAIRSLGHTPSRFADWTIIGAPQCLGRLAGTVTLDRFTKGGAPAVSPHLIPQHSLHSVSGALSILLGSRQPNFGVGGNDHSLAEALLASLTLPGRQFSGAWVIATGWEPEPVLDDSGQCTNSPHCYAVALALEHAATAAARGQLRLGTQKHSPSLKHSRGPRQVVESPSVAALARSLEQSSVLGVEFSWEIGGCSLALEARPAGQLVAAA